ncbi:hypothetical protein [uncultured Clostridium sp.]|uniref:hypothetical protein n=1 Tax=uncultured Clostridium sp. TaxID=59620 RepID=UPI0025D5C459|nr:hypothetical protein [uncultured Clostridium sp.]
MILKNLNPSCEVYKLLPDTPKIIEQVMFVKIFIINIIPNETMGRKHLENIIPSKAIMPYKITNPIQNSVSIPLNAENVLIAILKIVVIMINPIKVPISLDLDSFDV